MNPAHLTQVINGRRYDTEKATLLCSDAWWDGSNHERSGRNRFLYKTGKGNFFMELLTQWQEEHEHLEELNQAEAVKFFEECAEHGTTEMAWELAFPDLTVEDA